MRCWMHEGSRHERALLAAPNRLPRLPGRVKDEPRDDESDDRVGNLESERDNRRRGDDSEADEAVGSCMSAIGNERSTGKAIPGAKPKLGRDLISDEPDDTGEGKQPKVAQRARMKEPLNRLPQRDQRTDEDRDNDC